MTFSNAVRLANTGDLDAFGRLRISNLFSTFDMQFVYDLQPLFFEVVGTGGGGVSHLPDTAAARLSTGGTTDTHGVKFQTYQYFRYQPGKSNFVAWTCILGVKTSNVRKRIGYFDDDNGLFLEQDGSNVKIVRRTKTSGSVVDNAVNQSSWNLDKLDGTGSSGVTYDETKDNIYIIDFQHLGAGRIRFGFDFDGQITYFHEIKFANTEAVPFMTTGTLPFRAEIFNTATASGTTTLDFTCVSLTSEGGFNPLGVPGSINNTALREVTTINDPLPIISIKPRTTFNSITNRGTIVLKDFSIVSEDSTIFYQLVFNGSLTNASFANVDTTNSSVQVDVSATAMTGGLIIASGFLTGAKDKTESGHINEELLNKLNLSNDYAGTTTDVLTITCSIINSAGTSSDCGGSFAWKELR